jgi:hypothetical protein
MDLVFHSNFEVSGKTPEQSSYYQFYIMEKEKVSYF